MGIPFKYDLCHFRNVNQKDPIPGNVQDDFSLLCIRRGSLDEMCRRESSTVSGNFWILQQDYYDSMDVFGIKNTHVCDRYQRGQRKSGNGYHIDDSQLLPAGWKVPRHDTVEYNEKGSNVMDQRI